MTTHFHSISPGQARALGRIAKQKDAPKKLVIGFVDGTDEIIVVPPSRFDSRRWDVTKGGRVRRVPR